jgi:ATP-binding cassette subfamily C (CFTR/MRP) protein 4
MKDTLEGMTTIKAFHAETRLKDEFNDHLDVNTSACYILQCTTTGFGFFVEIICNLYVGIVIVVLLTVHDPVNPKSNLFEDVGFVITHTFLLIQLLQRVLYQWTEVETQMTALERIFEYVDVESESQVGKTFENWPKFGEMESLLENNSEDKFFVGLVKAHEKIGISGTSESSKSLIISRLLRLYPSHDTTIIDGVDIKALSLNSLRSKISVLSQDPLVLTGTIRDNIDPNGKHTDEEIWRVIEVVGLKSVIFDLDSVVLAGGSNFNQGQKQLLCLARALALGNKIVIVDNITAQLDSQTRCLVRDVIKTSFSFCTCIIFDQHLCSTLKCDRNI